MAERLNRVLFNQQRTVIHAGTQRLFRQWEENSFSGGLRPPNGCHTEGRMGFCCPEIFLLPCHPWQVALAMRSYPLIL